MRQLLPLILVLALAGCNGTPGGAPTPGASAGATASTNATFAPPTQAEVEATIKRDFTELYGVDNGGAKFDKVTITVGTAAVGGLTTKELSLGTTQQCYPVKVTAQITVTYSNNPTVRNVTRGDKSDDVFFFYKDTFNSWQFKTGSL